MYFKVVSPALTSLHGVPDFMVTYKAGKWTHPVIERSQLFVFDDYDNAEHFMEQYPSIMFICEVSNPTPVTKAAGNINFEAFWQGNNPQTKPLPEGTFGCNSVNLTQAIAANLRTTPPLC